MKEWFAKITEWVGELSLFNRKAGKRVLVNEILSMQVISAALIGILAVASLYWGGQWVLKDSYSRWAMQWTEEHKERRI